MRTKAASSTTLSCGIRGSGKSGADGAVQAAQPSKLAHNRVTAEGNLWHHSIERGFARAKHREKRWRRVLQPDQRVNASLRPFGGRETPPSATAARQVASKRAAALQSDPNGTRTRVAGVKGRSPRPLDDGAHIGD